MSRFRKFAHGLFSAYALLGANILYTLASVPLALHYLSRAEFGLWALTSQIATFISLIDLGMGSSIARILIDHKDRRQDGHYGAIIKTGALVGAAQGMVVFIAGIVLAFFLGGWLLVTADLSRPFFWLVVGQVFIVAVSFSSRTFGQVLYAWQRLDIQNYAQVFQSVVSLLALWLGFCCGLGIYSLLVSTVAGWACATAACAIACLKLELWPRQGEWGRVSMTRFLELFGYGTDVFLIAIGTQLIISSQTILISRIMGMEAVALWSVMTKIYSAVSQLSWRVIGNAMPVLAEMHVRGEHNRLWQRYRGLFMVTNVLVGVCGVFLVAGNGPFVALWTHGRFSWSMVNDILLGAWLVILTQQCCHNSLIICFKEIRGLKYIFLAEGITVVSSVWVVLPRAGITGMLACSVTATLLFTWLNGNWRMTRLAGGLRWKVLLWDWQLPLFRILAVMVPFELVMLWVSADASPAIRLLVNVGLLLLVTAWAATRLALPRELVEDLVNKLPPALQRWAVIVIERRNDAHNM